MLITIHREVALGFEWIARVCDSSPGEELFAGGGAFVSYAAFDQYVYSEIGTVGWRIVVCAGFAGQSIDGCRRIAAELCRANVEYARAGAARSGGFARIGQWPAFAGSE